MDKYSPNSSISSTSSSWSSSSSLLEFQWLERSVEAETMEEVSNTEAPFNRMVDKHLALDVSNYFIVLCNN